MPVATTDVEIMNHRLVAQQQRTTFIQNIHHIRAVLPLIGTSDDYGVGQALKRVSDSMAAVEAAFTRFNAENDNRAEIREAVLRLQASLRDLAALEPRFSWAAGVAVEACRNFANVLSAPAPSQLDDPLTNDRPPKQHRIDLADALDAFQLDLRALGYLEVDQARSLRDRAVKAIGDARSSLCATMMSEPEPDYAAIAEQVRKAEGMVDELGRIEFDLPATSHLVRSWIPNLKASCERIVRLACPVEPARSLIPARRANR